MSVATAPSIALSAPVVARGPVRIRTLLAIATAIVVLVALINVTSPPAIGLMIALAALTPWIIAKPLRGLQVLVAGAVLVEIAPLYFPDSLTDRIPLFANLNITLNLPVSATPAELLMALLLVLAVARSNAEARARLLKGRLLVPYVLFLATVLLGEVHGLLAGGDFNKSLWEVRPQIYGFIGFVLATLLIRSRQDIERLAVVVLVAILVKAAIGDVRYFIVLNHSLGTHETVLGHEDSYFLALVPMASVATLIWTGWSRTFQALALASALATAALLANERRAGIAALGAGIAVIAVLAIRYNALRRRRVLLVSLLVLIAAIVFLIAFWNVQTGLIGQLVRPVRSQFDPSYRDYLSDIYRQAENMNLKLSFDTNRLIGMGFGMPFLIVLTQADISNIYPLWNYIPHNTLLWIGVRMGLLGCATFWGLFGTALLEVCRSLQRQRERVVLVVVALAGGAIISEIFVAYADLQLESYRNMIFVGCVLGLLNIVPRLFPEKEVEARALG